MREGSWVGLDVHARCLRGVSTLTAFASTVELGDWHRFRAESLGGLSPSESSSGERRRQGATRSTPEIGAAPHLAYRSCGTNPRI
jgi:hypothetical protein